MDEQFSRSATVCLCRPVISAFLRLTTNKGFVHLLSLDEAEVEQPT